MHNDSLPIVILMLHDSNGFHHLSIWLLQSFYKKTAFMQKMAFSSETIIPSVKAFIVF